jgi:hypothetical protein
MRNFPDILRNRSGLLNRYPRRGRVYRSLATILTILLLTSTPVKAGPVTLNEVIQVLGRYQQTPDLRLRSLTQSGNAPASGVKGSSGNSDTKQANPDGPGSLIDTTVSGGGSLLRGVSFNDPQRGVEIVDQGDVQGTICDCGEILIPGGGFPKWPLLFLAAIPLFFIVSDDDFETPTSTPTPPGNPVPPPTLFSVPPGETPIPEPASLLLFGSGIAALGLRYRRRKSRGKTGSSG